STEIGFCITTGRSAGGPTNDRYSIGSWAGSGSGSSAVRPTSSAQVASATICAPGKVAPTGVPGLTAKDSSSSGHLGMSWVNLTQAASTSGPACWVSRSAEVKTTAYDEPSISSIRQDAGSSSSSTGSAPPGSSTRASSRVERKLSVLLLSAAASRLSSVS